MECPKCEGEVLEKHIDVSKIAEKFPIVKSFIKIPDWLEERRLRILFCAKCGYVVEMYLEPRQSG
ncbi:MAG: hypothetical protein DRN04_08210 [Thermoprotei archaeon]|nr:MAG: hypothetical protein DRN04_08210 [Thermoprotei archaeon]